MLTSIGFAALLPSVNKIVITGFNTDIERDGVVYHVQTEDKGLGSPLILSLVYSGGEILAAKRTPYEDLIASGFDDEELAERLKRQHRLICAAINAGRIEELKRMSARPKSEIPSEGLPAEAADESLGQTDSAGHQPQDQLVIETAAERPQVSDWRSEKEAPSEAALEAPPVAADLPVGEDLDATPGLSAPKVSAYTVYDSRRPTRGRKAATGGKAAKRETRLVLTILDEEEFRAGETVAIRVLLQRSVGNEEKSLAGVQVSVKVLGTTFRPQIYSVKTARDGVAVVSVDIPRFTSGRAAVLIRAEAHDQSAELRSVIHPAV